MLWNSGGECFDRAEVFEMYSAEIAIAALARSDPELAALMRRVGDFRLPFRTAYTPYQELLRSIMYQQLATRAASTIYARLLELFPRRDVSAEVMATLTDEALRAAGISRPKISAVRALTAAALDNTLPSQRALSLLDDQAIIEQLSRIHGIGRWTVEMLLIFQMARADVLPTTDLGVRRGFMMMQGTAQLPSPAALETHGERWRPHRSVAAWYLWRAND